MENYVSKMQERIEIFTTSGSIDAGGEYTETSSSLAEVWVWAMPKSGREGYSADSDTPTEKYNFLMRHRTDFDTGDIIEFNGKKYDVEYIDPFYKAGRNNFILVQTSYTEGQY